VLTSRLTPSIVHGAIVLVRERSDGALALAILAGLLPESERSALFAEAVATAEQIDDPDDRAEALGKMSKYLPEALLGRVLEGIRAVGKSKYIGLSTRAEALANLVPRLVRQPVRTLDPMFRDTLHVLANHGRPELLWDLAALPSLLSKLGGVEAVSKVAREVIDATRRWP
jgi:hypothetical protein